jgi:hypothetical protein
MVPKAVERFEQQRDKIPREDSANGAAREDAVELGARPHSSEVQEGIRSHECTSGEKEPHRRQMRPPSREEQQDDERGQRADVDRRAADTDRQRFAEKMPRASVELVTHRSVECTEVTSGADAGVTKERIDDDARAPDGEQDRQDEKWSSMCPHMRV